jgi:hypothetical protein
VSTQVGMSGRCFHSPPPHSPPPPPPPPPPFPLHITFLTHQQQQK